MGSPSSHYPKGVGDFSLRLVKSIGKLSKEQKEVIEQLNKEKYLAVCCFGIEEAKKVIIDYFS